MTDVETYGPIDFVLLEFTGDKLTGKAAAALLDLVERGIVRIYDLIVVRKDADGTFSGIELDASLAEDLGEFVAFEGVRSGLLGDEDLAAAAEAMAPGTVAAAILYENTWAIPFVAAVRESGGELVASAHIPAKDVMDALDALEAND